MILGPAAESAKTSQEQAQGDDHSTDAAADSNGNQQHQRAEKDGIISEEDCVRGIAHVARLVALGVLTPSKANTIRASLRDILQYHRNKSKQAEKGVANGDVLDILKKDPQLLSLLEPLLSQSQIDMIMKNANGGT
jgi:hypothetical protein